MLWDDTDEQTVSTIPDDIVDLVFHMECRSLPLDHAYALAQAIEHALPWFAEDPDCALHLVHGADSGNGWQRPEAEDGEIYLSRRTRLTLRLPRRRVDAARELSGVTLDIEGHPLKVGKAMPKSLSANSVLFARHILADAGQSEENFLQSVQEELRGTGIRCRKLMCGRSGYLNTPRGKLFTRSLMVADLSREDAVLLLQKGLGGGRKLGCGVFIPHKDIKAVSPAQLDQLLS